MHINKPISITISYHNYIFKTRKNDWSYTIESMEKQSGALLRFGRTGIHPDRVGGKGGHFLWAFGFDRARADLPLQTTDKAAPDERLL
jgi:hypothetical protein